MYFSISYQNTLHPTIKFVSNYLFKSFSFLYLKVSPNDRMGSAGIIEIVLSLNLQLNISTFSAHHFTPYTLNELFHSALPRNTTYLFPQRDVQYQGCQLYRLIRETPDFEPFLPVSRVESEFPKYAISCIFTFLTMKFQIFCVDWAIIPLKSNVSSQTPVYHWAEHLVPRALPPWAEHLVPRAKKKTI